MARSVPEEPIAVIGIAGRFPSAPDVRTFWQLLLEGDGVTEAPRDREWMRALYDPEPGAKGRVPTTRGGFLPELDLFDAEFFEISPREAARTDPQQRLLLEVAYETAQDAGIPVGRLARQHTGVFVGSLFNDFWFRQVDDLSTVDMHAAVGGAPSALAGRISYAFGWTGPSMTVDAACASSLVTVHMACQALRAGECDVALAAGANIILNPHGTVALARALSPGGRCRFGDADADGYVRSEAVAALLLKPLDRAVADGDRIRAVIRGSAVGHTGATGQGMSTPTANGQEAVLRAAYARAGIVPGKVSYAEAHGTGTVAGDPVELEALVRVLKEGRNGGERCAVGSAKTVVGHTEGAAGIVGLIKAVLCLERRQVPGNRQLRTPNPAVDWASAPLFLPQDTFALPAHGELTAGVNSFGVNGTNAHVILTSAPEPATHDEAAASGLVQGQQTLLALSARSTEALDALVGRYADLLDQPDVTREDLADIASQAASGRDHYEYRLAAIAESPDGMLHTLRSHVEGQVDPDSLHTNPEGCWQRPRIIFVFPGQGSQWADMGRDLLASPGPFRETMERCDAVIREHTGWSILQALRGRDESWLHSTARVQPALWAMSVSLAAQWRSLGIHPDAVLGQSQGEIAAAQVAGALTLEQAGYVSCVRAQLAAEHARPGSLCWVNLPHTGIPDLLDALGQKAEIAVQESATSTVLAGTTQAIEAVVAGAQARNINCLPISANYASHSPGVDPVKRPLLQALADLTPADTTIPFLSTVTADIADGRDLDGTYWWRNLREPVKLADTVRRHCNSAADPTVLLQVSPHPVLTRALQGPGRTVLATLHRDEHPADSLTTTLAQLYTAGVTVDWTTALGTPKRHVALPTYPWQRTSHWHQAANFPWPAPGAPGDGDAPAMVPEPKPACRPSKPAAAASAGQQSHPDARRTADVSSGAPVWETALDPTEHGFLLEHRIKERPVLPAVAYLDVALTAAVALGHERAFSEVTFAEMLLLDDTGDWDLTLRVRQSDGADFRVESITGRTGAWRVHTRMRLASKAHTPDTAQRIDLADLRARCTDWQPGEAFYRASDLRGNQWRGAFRRIAELWQGHDESLARLRPLDPSGYHLHPALLDAALQTAAITGHDSATALTAIDQIRVHRAYAGGEAWAHFASRPPKPGDLLCGDITLADEHGNLLATLRGVRARSVEPRSAAPEQPAQPPAPARPVVAAHSLDLRWEPVPLTAHKGRPAARTWILLSGECPEDRALTQSLRQAGHTVVTVRRGRGYARLSGTDYLADHTDEGDLLHILRDIDQPVAGILHTAALACPTTPDASPKEVQWTAVDLCASLLPLAHAVHRAQRDEQPRVFVLTRGTQHVLPGDQVNAPWQAPLWALAQAVSTEIPQCPTVLIDLDAPTAPGEADILTELLLTPHQENQLALREHTAYTPRLVPVARETPVPRETASAATVRRDTGATQPTRPPSHSAGTHVIRPDVTYLVVGGLSGVGGLFADWLVAEGARHLLLTGRSLIVPDPDSNDPRAARLARLTSTRNVRTAYAPVDVADEDAMRELLHRRHQQGHPAVAGVVHSALALTPRLLKETTTADIDATLRPKVAGGWTLHRLFPGRELDFFVLFSSHLSLFAGLRMAGQVGVYAAANAFIDSLAAHRRARGLPATVVNWSYWSDTGAAFRLGEQAGQSVTAAGTTPLTPEDAPDLFTAVLATHGVVRCVPVDWHEYLRETPRDAGNPLLHHLRRPSDDAPAKEAAPPEPVEPERRQHPAERPAWPTSRSEPLPAPDPHERLGAGHDDLTKWLVDQVAEVLGIRSDAFEPNRPPRRLGLDSLLAAEIGTRLRSERGIEATVQDILRAPSLTVLAERLSEKDQTTPRNQ